MTWFRDGRPRLIPQARRSAGAIGGHRAGGARRLGISWSPLLASTGVLMGLRARPAWLLAGRSPGWASRPWLVARHLVAKHASLYGLSRLAGLARRWASCWPAASCRSLSIGARLALATGDLASRWSGRRAAGRQRRRRAARPPARCRGPCCWSWPRRRSSWSGAWSSACTRCVTAGGAAHGGAVWPSCRARRGRDRHRARGPGRDAHPALLSGQRPTSSLILAGSVSMGTASQVGADPVGVQGRPAAGGVAARSWCAQVLGALIGGAGGGAGLPGDRRGLRHRARERMPAPSAMSWKATAEAVRGGLALPPHAPVAAAPSALAAGRGAAPCSAARRLGSAPAVPGGDGHRDAHAGVADRWRPWSARWSPLVRCACVPASSEPRSLAAPPAGSPASR